MYDDGRIRVNGLVEKYLSSPEGEVDKRQGNVSGLFDSASSVLLLCSALGLNVPLLGRPSRDRPH
jgi:hypothetical protein